MKRYYFTVAGMGIEKGIICFTCVHKFIKHLADNKSITALNYSSVKKQFVLESRLESIEEIETIILESLKYASVELNKEFLLTSLEEE